MKHLYLSEILNKTFDSVEALKEAEAEYMKEKEQKEAERTERKRRADEVTAAYEEVRAAEKKYEELLTQFLKDYKSYHSTVTLNKMPITFKDFLNFF